MRPTAKVVLTLWHGTVVTTPKIYDPKFATCTIGFLHIGIVFRRTVSAIGNFFEGIAREKDNN